MNLQSKTATLQRRYRERNKTQYIIHNTTPNTTRDNKRRTVQTTLNQWRCGGKYINSSSYSPLNNPTHNSSHKLRNNDNLHQSQTHEQKMAQLKHNRTTAKRMKDARTYIQTTIQGGRSERRTTPNASNTTKLSRVKR